MERLDEHSVLVLDAHWKAIGTTTPKLALTDMAKGSKVGLYIHADGGSLEPIKWPAWIELPIGATDHFVSTARTRVKIPTIVIAANFVRTRVQIKKPRISTRTVREAYGGRCAYTQRPVGTKGSIDHVVPLSRGGKNEWSNVVWSDAEVNHSKAARTPAEAGLPTPVIVDVKPKAAVLTIRPRPDRPEWSMFLPHLKDTSAQ